MSDYFAKQLTEYSLETPQEPMAIIVWLLWFAALIIVSIRYRNQQFKFDRKTLIRLAVLSLSILILTSFFYFPLSSNTESDNPNQLILFAAVPWLTAGGIVGIIPAVLLAGMSGLLAAYLHTHQVFTPLIFMTTAIIFTLSIRQRYRTFIFRLLRFPLVAALFSVLISLPFIFIASLFNSSGALPLRIVDVINEFPGEALSFGGMVLIGGFFCIFISLIAGKEWGTQQTLKPSPGETNLRFRVITIVSLVLLTLSVVLLISSWRNAENQARRTAVTSLTSTANLASENLTGFLRTGESLISWFAEDDQLLTQDTEILSTLLSQKLNLLPYFDQIAVIDSYGKVIAFSSSGPTIPLPSELAVNNLFQPGGKEISLFASPDLNDNESSGFTLNLLVKMNDPSNTVNRILWGTTAFNENNAAAPVIELFNSLKEYSGTGQIVDDRGVILFQMGTPWEGDVYTGVSYPTATFFEGKSVGGEWVLQYYQPVENTGWAVITSLPRRNIQASAWQSINPFLLFSFGGIIVVFLVLLIVLLPVEKGLKQLEKAVNNIAAGKADPALLPDGSIQAMPALWEAFQRMINSIKKLERDHPDLLTLSERIADQLTLQEALQLFLIVALDRGVSSARILVKDSKVATGSFSPHYRIGLGEQASLLAALDEDILDLTSSRGMLVFQDYQFGKLVSFRKGMPYPASVIAVPLVLNEESLGVLWVTYHDRRRLQEEDPLFFKELSKRAALAIINARSVGKSVELTNQFERVLNNLNDPVMVSDDLGRIVLLNQAAQSLINKQEDEYIGRMVSSVFQDENFLSLLQGAEKETHSMEIQLANGKTYDVVGSPIHLEDQQKGVIALFKDVTHYKVQDALKTEYVTTASHELSSPLTLIHGYAKILRLTGNLNEQQDTYVRNIVERVEEMRILIQNLLDLGRLETGTSLDVEDITAGEVINKAVEGLIAQSNQKNINLRVSLPETPIKLEADDALLTLAVRNLIDNAVKFTKMGGDVSVTARVQDEDVLFEIKDTGVGIAPLDLRHIFDRFNKVRLQNEEAFQGSGLGLAIVKSIADRHYGKVWADSKLGRGSTFYLRIPKKQKRTG